MKQHVTVVGVLHIGLSILGLLAAAIVLVVLVGTGILVEDRQAMTILTSVGCGVSALLVVLFLPGIVGGIGLLKWRPWARILVMILAVVDLFNVPIGTAIGVYTMWVLTHEETIELFAHRGGQPAS
jgi:hypothetical protein